MERIVSPKQCSALVIDDVKEQTEEFVPTLNVIINTRRVSTASFPSVNSDVVKAAVEVRGAFTVSF